MVQLRIKDIFDSESYNSAKGLVEMAREHNIPVLINDRPDMALSLKADGVHLGRADVSPAMARAILGPSAIIGCTVRSREEYLSDRLEPADYVAIGPVRKTPLKPGLKKTGSVAVRQLCRVAKIPVVAIGGINLDNARDVLALGVDALAFIRYAAFTRNIGERIKKLRECFGA